MLVVVPPAVSYAESFNYVDSAFFGGYQEGSTSGHTARQYNKVWRPAGSPFRLTYASDGTHNWYNTWSNPFTVTLEINDAYSKCANEAITSVSPVTCQTTRP